MKIFDFAAYRQETADFQARLDGIKEAHGKSHPRIDSLQKVIDDRISAVDGAESELKAMGIDDMEAALEDARLKGHEKGIAEARERCEAIMACADKYGCDDREIQKLKFKSLADAECSISDFKLALIELMSNRKNSEPTSTRAELGGGDGRGPGEIDKLRAQLETEDDPKARRNLVKRIKALRNK